MLFTIPVELQANILGLLPRRDLARVVRTSRHLHAVGVAILYTHVELRSLDQVEAFFQISSLLAQGSAVALRHADAKEDQWKAIKTLEIDVVGWDTSSEPSTDLPRSLRGQGLEPFPLDRLRLSYTDNPAALLPILQRFNPRELGLRRVALGFDSARVFDSWMSATGWSDVTHLTLVGEKNDNGFGTSAEDSSIRLTNVGHMALLCHYWSGHSYSGTAMDIEFLVRLCPNAEGCALLVRSLVVQDEVESLVRRGQAGKPADFYSVAYEPLGSNVWGEVEKPEVDLREEPEDASEEQSEKVSESSSDQDLDQDSEEDSEDDSDEASDQDA